MAGEHASALSTSLSNDPAMSRAFFLLASGDEKRPNDGNPGLPDLATLCRQAAKTSEVPRMTPPGTNLPPLPRAPLLDWSSFSPAKVSAELHSIDNIRHTQMTTSGRAAIYQALLQLRLAPASVVLVPTYHCPTMIAPVILAQLEVAYFGISADGLPKLDSIDPATAAKAKAMLVPHYFGLAKSLDQVRQWCDEHQIALIEDCAHCYFGNAGERPVGTWGDFSTASLSKFFPVPEGGVLASASRTIVALDLAPQGFKAQLKAWVDVFESAVSCGRFAGINWALAGLLRVKNSLAHGRQGDQHRQASAPEDIMLTCDMERISRAPLSPALLLNESPAAWTDHCPAPAELCPLCPTLRRGVGRARALSRVGRQRSALCLSPVGRGRRSRLPGHARPGPARSSAGTEAGRTHPGCPMMPAHPGAGMSCSCFAIRI
jgi:hypothetical protein